MLVKVSTDAMLSQISTMETGVKFIMSLLIVI